MLKPDFVAKCVTQNVRLMLKYDPWANEKAEDRILSLSLSRYTAMSVAMALVMYLTTNVVSLCDKDSFIVAFFDVLGSCCR